MKVFVSFIHKIKIVCYYRPFTVNYWLLYQSWLSQQSIPITHLILVSL